jgi:hypothetical protein
LAARIATFFTETRIFVSQRKIFLSHFFFFFPNFLLLLLVTKLEVNKKRQIEAFFKKETEMEMVIETSQKIPLLKNFATYEKGFQFHARVLLTNMYICNVHMYIQMYIYVHNT